MTESNRIEYKREVSNSLEREVVAFLNYPDGGIVYIGIDKHGQTIGVRDADALQLAMKDRIKHNIQPSALGLFDVILEQRDGKPVIKIILASGPENPITYANTACPKRAALCALAPPANPCQQR